MAKSVPQTIDGLCPWCKAPMAPGAVLCLQCGYHLERGTKVDVDLSPNVAGRSGKMAVVRDPANPYRSPATELGDGEPRQRNVLRSLFTASGRIPRWQFWAWMGAYLVNIVVCGNLLDAGLIPEALPVISMLFFLWFLIAAQIKRWHDIDRSGWLVLINFVPFGSLYSLAELGFQRGKHGPNEYGPDPLEP